jgi:hypothetical protein
VGWSIPQQYMNGVWRSILEPLKQHIVRDMLADSIHTAAGILTGRDLRGGQPSTQPLYSSDSGPEIALKTPPYNGIDSAGAWANAQDHPKRASSTPCQRSLSSGPSVEPVSAR